MSTTTSSEVPPLQQALPQLVKLVERSFGLTFSLSKRIFSLVQSLTYPITVLAPIPWNAVLYLFAPFIFLVQLLLEVFVLAPTRATTYFLDLVYPIYIFLGVAVLIGAFLGLIARTITKYAMYSLEPKSETEKQVSQT